MSWLARSLANSLRLDDDDRYNENDVVSDPPTTSPRNYSQQQQQHQLQENELASEIEEEENNDETEGRGVKEDLDEIKQTLTRQFWGMASFLAPPPTTSESDPSSFVSNQSDHSLSDNEQQQQQQQLDDAVNSNQSSDMEQVALGADDPDPNLSAFGSDSEGNLEPECDLQNAVGITEEVLTFATNIAMHPETWLDFPIDEEDDTDGKSSSINLRKSISFTNHFFVGSDRRRIITYSVLNCLYLYINSVPVGELYRIVNAFITKIIMC